MYILLEILAWLLVGALATAVSVIYDDGELKVEDLDGSFLFLSLLGPITVGLMLWYLTITGCKKIHEKHGKKVLFKLAPKK